MRKKNLFLLFCLSAVYSIANAQPQVIKIEPGVSLKLANYRKANIGDLQYDLNFEVPAEKSAPIKANGKISFETKQNNQPLQLDFKQDASYLNWIKVNGKPVPINLQKEHILITNYRKGKNIIEISFTAGNESLNRNDDFLYALFVPDHARAVFPCFDQPDLKGKFKLTLAIPQGWQAMSNGTLLDSVSHNGQTTIHFANSDKLPTYLFSFTAGKYSAVKKMIGQRSADFFYRETDQQKIKLSVDSVFDQHKSAIDFLEKWTGMRYPFQKLGFVAIPDFQFGGMEHPGEIQYKASSLFLDDAATKNMRISRINLISHETAHMWFGDMVTMRWFNDVWMKEVFANFMADKVTEQLMGTETFNLKFLQDHYPAAYNVDRTLGSNPIRQQLDNLKDAGSMYGDIIYHKAPVMMRQLELLMGADRFQAGIRQYLKQYAYANATWPNLISILSKHTKADLYTWNKVWVNETGRPVINGDVQYNGDRISKFILTQTSETGEARFWPQAFEVALVYPDHIQRLPVNLKTKTIVVTDAVGLKKPLHIIFNSNGMGYGVFPVDESIDPPTLYAIKSPLLRACVYINAYENMLNGQTYNPEELMMLFEAGLSKEHEETNLRMLTGYISTVYWRLLTPASRAKQAPLLEQTLWKAMQQQASANNKKILFNTYYDTYLTEAAGKQVYNYWQTQHPPDGVKLTEDDYTAIALTLALKSDTTTSVLQQQLNRVKNPDRKKRLAFLMPALSANVAERDSFFNSLKQRKGREKEAWVSTALSYLHHPLRQGGSIKYVPESLNLLEEIQATGDIFFPQSFINATLSNYQSKEVIDMVSSYIKSHPALNSKLKNKLLQGADNVLRAAKLKM